MIQEVVYYTLWTIWDIIDLICIYCILYIMFDMPKKKPHKRIILYFVIYIVLTLIHPYAMYKDFNLIMFLLYYLKAFPIMCECLKTKSKGLLIVNIWMYEVVMSFMQETIMSVMSWKYPGIVWNRYAIIIIYMVIGFFVFAGTLIIKRKRRSKQISLYFSSLSIWTYFFLSTALFGIMAIENVVFNKPELLSKANLYMKVMLIIVIVSFLCLVIVIFSTSKEKISSQKVAGLLTEQIENMTVYYTQISKKDEELRCFKHDSKNLLLGLHAMLEANNIEQAKEYINHMENIYQSGTHEFDSGNYIADAIMSTKKSIASQYDIAIDFEGFIPAQKIKDTDLCIFLTNAMDNAIEACQKVIEKRYIHIRSRIVKRIWIITVSNSVDSSPNIINNTIETSKEDKEFHGYGLLTIRQVVEKYHGQMKLECEKNEFLLTANFVLTDMADEQLQL